MPIGPPLWFRSQSLAVCSNAGSGEGIAREEEQIGYLAKVRFSSCDQRERTEVNGLKGSTGSRLSHAEKRELGQRSGCLNEWFSPINKD